MSDDTGYQGWTNYPTWAIALWLGNEQASYDDMVAIATDTDDEQIEIFPGHTYTQPRAHIIADQIKDYVTDGMDTMHWYENMPGMLKDLLEYALQLVDWREIAEHYAEDFPYAGSDDE